MNWLSGEDAEIQQYTKGGAKIIANKGARLMKKGEIPAHLIGHNITHEKAVLYAKRRVELAQQRAEEGIMEAVAEWRKDGKMPKTGTDAWKIVVKELATSYLKSGSLRDKTNALPVLGKVMGTLSEKGEQQQANDMPLANLEDALIYLEIHNHYEATKEQPKEVIDAEFTESRGA